MAFYSTGTVNLVRGSSSVTGVSTSWNTGAITANWFVTFNASKSWFEIKSINSANNLTLFTPYDSISQNGVPYLAVDAISVLTSDFSQLSREQAQQILQLLMFSSLNETLGEDPVSGMPYLNSSGFLTLPT